MAYKDILVQFDDSPSSVKRLEAAASLAARHDAHLTALVLDVEPSIVSFADASYPAWVIEELRKATASARELTIARLDELLSRQNCRTARSVARCGAGEIASTLGLYARYADLLVLGQPAPSGPVTVGREAIEDILMSSGRPVLLVPFIGAGDTIGERIVVAWDAGREAARAVHDAMPLVEAAKSVTVLSVNGRFTRGAPGDIPGADIALHLARHGVQIEAVSLKAGDLDAADVTLNWMADHGADLLVMGAYGHSRLRDLVLGGMTRSILDRMTVPVLMSH